MTNTNPNPTPQNRKRNLGLKLGIIGAAVALVVGSVPVLDSISSNAATADGKFCVQAVSDAGKFKGQSGWKDCGDGPVPVEEPSSEPVPAPDLPVAGVCALPDAARTIYGIGKSSGTIESYKIDAAGKLSAGNQVATLASTNSNALGLTKLGSFYYLSNVNAARTVKPGGEDKQIGQINGMPGSIVAGAALVYKGHEEFYSGSIAPVSGVTKLTVYRSSTDATRTGKLFAVPLKDAPGNNGDFGFDRSGTLKVLVGGSSVAGASSVLGTVPFAAFADLAPNTDATLELSSQRSLPVPAGNGVAFIGTDMMAVSTSDSLTIWKIDGEAPVKLSSTTPSITLNDLADCG